MVLLRPRNRDPDPSSICTPEFFAEIDHVRTGAKLARLPKGSLGDIIAKYKEFGSWASLKSKTQTSYDRVFATWIRFAPYACPI